MAENTKIEWADHSWSPWRGCTKVSEGCQHCYAETLSKRNPEVLGQWGKGKPRVLAKNWVDPMRWNRREGGLLVDHSQFVSPTKPRIFPSLCDWLDEEVPIEWLAQFLKLIYDTPHLNWLLLTKRPGNWGKRILEALAQIEGIKDQDGWEGYPSTSVGYWLNDWISGEAPPNVWFGVSIENQKRADERIPQLLEIPATVRWLSIEPLLGPIDLAYPCFNGSESVSALGNINWAVIGGESGSGARWCDVEWIRSIVKQCRGAGMATFVKQLGSRPCRSWPPGPVHPSCPPEIAATTGEGWTLKHPKGGDPDEWPPDLRIRQFPFIPTK